jgi:hypothetical protein
MNWQRFQLRSLKTRMRCSRDDASGVVSGFGGGDVFLREVDDPNQFKIVFKERAQSSCLPVCVGFSTVQTDREKLEKCTSKRIYLLCCG